MADIRVYALDEVASILQITRRTLYTYVKTGKLRAVKIGKYWRVAEQELQDFIATGTSVMDTNRRKENQAPNGR